MSATTSEQITVSPAELASFTRQLGAMLDAGVNVLRALRIASQHTGNPRLILVSQEISRLLKDGREFHQALAPHPELFDPFYLEMARQGESDGLLGKALLSVADYLDRLASGPHAAPGALLAPHGGGGVQTPVAATTMTVIGVQAIGAAVVWALATALPDRLPLEWLGPIAALWCGVVLLSGAWVLRRIRQPAAPAAVDRPAPLPPKAPERKAAETEGLVRSALDEQAEEEEELVVGSPVLLNGQRGGHGPNGNGQGAATLDHDEPENRFRL